jgi:hypothetical protein
MGSKVIDIGALTSREDVYVVLSSTDEVGRAYIKQRLLDNLSTSGAGDIVNVDDLTYYIFELINIASVVTVEDL